MARTPRAKIPDPTQPSFPPIVRIGFDFDVTESLRLPAYPASAWRGLLGHSLRRTVCVTRQPTCQGCILTATCAYSVFFESPPPSWESRRRYTAVPHPFVLEVDAHPERNLSPGDRLRLGVNLIGPAIHLLPYLIQAMDRAGKMGLGRTGGRFALRTVLAESGLGSGDWHSVYSADAPQYHRVVGEPIAPGLPPSAPLVVDLLTPLRIKRRGHFVGAGEFAAEDLLRNLLWRLSHLATFYGDREEPFDWAQVLVKAGEVKIVASELQWLDWTRFSSRQNTAMQMGGLVGKVILEGTGVADVWPALRLGLCCRLLE